MSGNSDKQKRKYGDSRRARTEQNRKSKLRRAELHQAYLVQRTQSLINTQVAVRVKDHIKPMVGTVIAILRKGDDEYPEDARRNVGAYLKVRTNIGDLVVSRHRAKPLKG